VEFSEQKVYKDKLRECEIKRVSRIDHPIIYNKTRIFVLFLKIQLANKSGGKM